MTIVQEIAGSAMVKLYRDLMYERSSNELTTVSNVVVKIVDRCGYLLYRPNFSFTSVFHYDVFDVYNKDECVGCLQRLFR